MPGVSRSGATLTAGLFLGFERRGGAFLAPALRAGRRALRRVRAAPYRRGRATPSFVPTAIATLCAFVVGYASIAFLLRWLGNHSTARVRRLPRRARRARPRPRRRRDDQLGSRDARALSRSGLSRRRSWSLACARVARDYADTALNIVPSGQYGGPGTRGCRPAGAHVRRAHAAVRPGHAADLTKYFKSEALGAGPRARADRARPAPRRTIVRDRFNVPHITGKTRDDVIWATGWVLRRTAGCCSPRAATRRAWPPSTLPASTPSGSSPASDGQARSRRTGSSTAADGALSARGQGRRRLLHDIDVYVRASTRGCELEKSKPKPYTRVDIYAINALAGQIFGAGRRRRGAALAALDGLRKRLGAGPARPCSTTCPSTSTRTRRSRSTKLPVRADPAGLRGQRDHRHGLRTRRPEAQSPTRQADAARVELPDGRRATARPPGTRCSSPARRSATSTPA